MAEKNNVQDVRIVPSEINQRATILRSDLTKYVTMIKCGDPAEIEQAKHNFDCSVIEFKKAVVLNS